MVLEGADMAISVVAFSERLDGGHWVLQERRVMPFDARTYSAFLAGVLNTSVVPPIANPRGIPPDVSKAVQEEFKEYGTDAVAPSWLTIEELQTFDYELELEDRRVARKVPGKGWIDHAVTCEPGEGKVVTYREFLLPGFFDELDRIARSGAHRIVFWFSI
jgi:hypothetical protein